MPTALQEEKKEQKKKMIHKSAGGFAYRTLFLSSLYKTTKYSGSNQGVKYSMNYSRRDTK